MSVGYRELTGSQAALQARVEDLHRRGLLVKLTPPQPDGDQWRMQVWLRQPAQRPIGATRQPVRARQATWGVRELTPGQRRAAGFAALVGGAGLALTGVVWLIVRVVSSAASWVGANPAVVVLAVLVLGVAGLLLRTRDRTKAGRGTGCPGLTHHCARCPDHR